MSHDEFFAAFDRYCADNNISEDEAPIAFAAFLHLRTGWDGEATKVVDATKEGE
jgi:hypothetical protein